MSITVELKPEVEARLWGRAREQGVSLGAYLQIVIEQALMPVNQKEEPTAPPSPQERAKAFRAWAESHSTETPLLSDFAVSRENIYEDEGV